MLSEEYMDIINRYQFKEKDEKKLKQFVMDYEWTEDKNKELMEENNRLSMVIGLLVILGFAGWLI